MQQKTLQILKDQFDTDPLCISVDGQLAGSAIKIPYPVRSLNANTIEEINGNNLQFKRFYNRFYWGYDFAENAIGSLLYGKHIKIARQLRSNMLKIKPGSSVLSVACGTGGDFETIPPAVLSTLHIVGLDISGGMVRQCRKKFNKWNIGIDLFVGSAEDLLFNDNAFDMVFSFGGINFFNSPQKAVRELIRVAKPGTRVFYGDETELIIRGSYQKLPLLKHFFKGKEFQINPLSWVPPTAKNPAYHTLWDGKMYVVSCEKKKW